MTTTNQKERIQKVLANAGVSSRRNVEEMVLQGRVSVNGKVMRALPVLVDPAADRVEVDGQRVKLDAPKVQQRYYFLLHKPKGVYTTNVAQGAQVRAIDLLPKDLHARLYPVGRLDSESTGLLLMTNDGELTNQLTHPRYGVAQKYRAKVDGYVQERTLAEVEKGVWLADRQGKGFKTAQSHIRIVHRTREKTALEIDIREGRNPAIRRVLASLGHKVRELTRVGMGPLSLEKLPPGHYRHLTPREVRELKASGKRREAAPRRRKDGHGDNEN